MGSISSQRVRLFALFTLLLMTSLAAANEATEDATDDAFGALAPLDIDKRLIAYWRFDEPAGNRCDDSSDNQYDATVDASRPGLVEKRNGIFGRALFFSGQHMLRTNRNLQLEGIRELSLSAWIMPTDLGGYCEIFRTEDGENRVLFSFQHGGTFLSLGLNVGGYIECEPNLRPQDLIDGRWHHCAATYDGHDMRVYLDGQQLGSVERPGRITAGGRVPACIGSSNGLECFQGGMDDLRIYEVALTADEISQLYQNGMEALAPQRKVFEQRLQALYTPADSFSAALTGTRKKMLQQSQPIGLELSGMLQAKLQDDFPDDCNLFHESTGHHVGAYLATEQNDINIRTAERLVGLLLEYEPLTEAQRCKQSPDQRRHWEEARRIAGRFDQLRATGDAASSSTDWIDTILAASRMIEFRPVDSEAVAPYQTPDTPSTVDRSAAQARQSLERDWLHQADDMPKPDRIVAEIGWACQLAARIASTSMEAVDFSRELEQLKELEVEAGALTTASTEIYFRVREVKRAIALKNPAIDFDQILLVDMPFPAGNEWRHETRHRLGYMAVPGGRLLVLTGLSPAGHLQQLMPQLPLHGSFWRPDLSFDARKALFCFKPHNEKAFHLYEIGLDGTGLVQLTDGPYDDLDPIYLPDGEHIMFSTTRSHTYVRCMPPTNAFVLARCDRQGDNIFLVSRNNEPDYLPSVMQDGRVVYTRWEYTDKPLWRAQGLWTVHPDGTQVNTLWGNQSVWPDLLKDARNIPGSQRIMFTGSAHHDWFAGAVGIIDPTGGHNFPNGLTKVTADLPWPESGNGPVDPIESPRYHPSGRYEAYYSPYPLNEHDFLVSARRQEKFLLYLMDTDGNRELIHEGTGNILHAMPVRPRPRPPAIADRVAWPDRANRLQPAGGVIYSNNVYHGAPAELRDQARYLRVLNIEPKTYTYWYKRPYLSTGPVVSAVQSEGVKRVLGTVPIEKDGSVAFHAPSGMALHFQLLDENFRALQTMRSFTGVMPGEQRGCLGCHELHSTSPEPYAQAIATSQQPRAIEPPPWGEETVSYARFVRPILSKYCGQCHEGDGEAVDVVDLTPRPGHLIFEEPYLILTGRPTWGRPYIQPEKPIPGHGIANMLMVEGYSPTDPEAYRTPAPMTQLSYKSPLIDLASSGKHYDVRVEPTDLRKLIAWVDTMCPYRGDEEVRALADPEFQGIDWLAIRPLIKTAPKIVRPGPVD